MPSKTSAGYSKRSLKDKLGLKDGAIAAVLNAPSEYDSLLGSSAFERALKRTKYDYLQYFTTSRMDLERDFAKLKQCLAESGMLWISWPKKSSKVPTNLDENIIREIGLRHGLVDVKVCAIDETWSGLKFVYRLKDRV